MSIVLVTGGTGAVGPRIVERFRQSGYRVRVLSRRPAPNVLPSDIDLRQGDVCDPRAVKDSMTDVSMVVHLAARLHITAEDAAHRDESKRINYVGTRNVVEAAIQHGVERLVHFSSISVYGAHSDATFSEESTVSPASVYAETKLAAEQLVLEAQRHDGRPLGTVLRVAAVYGSRIKGNYQQLLHALARGWFIPIGDGKNKRALIYDRDLADAALLAATHPMAAGRLYNVANNDACEMRVLVAIMCHALGRNPPLLAMPIGPTRAVCGVIEGLARTVGVRPPVTRAMVDKYIENVVVDTTRIRSELLFEPRYTLLEGWSETVRESGFGLAPKAAATH